MSTTASDTTEIDIETKVYEICVLIPFPLNQKEEQEIQKAVEGLIEEHGGKQVAKDVWGRRGLAYRIKGYDEGNYIVYYYELDPNNLKEIDEQMRIIPEVLRHMMVIPPKNYEITKYSESYETWLKERETVEDERKRKKEEVLKKKVADKAKRQARRAEETKKEEKKEDVIVAAKKADEAELEEEIEKLISDDIDL